jgi:signal transduction histidine kinase
MVAHDLRNPLNVIALQASRLLRSSVEDKNMESVTAPARRILAAAQGMEHMVKDLLDLSQIESGRLSIDRRSEDCEALLDEAVEMFAELAEAKRIRLRAQAPPMRAAIRCDRRRVLQIFSNLIGNALRFTQVGGSVDIGAFPDEGGVVFFVRDDGIGIRDEDLPRLFDAYFQGHHGDRKGGGVGLGLGIAKGIVEVHGGRIWAETVAGRGSTFYFSIPR